MTSIFIAQALKSVVQPSLFQCQVRVISIGLLWWIPYLSILRVLPGSAALVISLGAPVLVAFIAAIMAGPFDLLAIVSLLIPTAFIFFLDAHIYYVWHSRHVGTLLSPFPVLDVVMVIAALLFGGIGIAAKRRLVPERGMKLGTGESRLLYTSLFFDVGLLAGIVAVLLVFDAGKITHENDPLVLAAKQEQILASPTATEADKLQVVMRLQARRSPESIDVLQQALTSSFPSVKRVAAACLLQRGNTSGLAVLEEQLMHSSKFTIGNEHQVIHSDWLGYGEGGPVSLTFDLSSGLGAVSDPSAEPILTRLTSSEDPDIRDGATQALKNMQIEKTDSKLHYMH